MKKFFLTLEFALLLLTVFLILPNSPINFFQTAVASEVRCDVCGMTVDENSKNHIFLKNQTSTKPILHACSISCMRKLVKNDPTYTEIEFNDFNHTERRISAKSAFFLLDSKKIKMDLGEMVMPPYFGAFVSKKEAEAALKKYGDGVIVEGLDKK